MDDSGHVTMYDLCEAAKYLNRGKFCIICDSDDTTRAVKAILNGIYDGYRFIQLEAFADALEQLARKRIEGPGDDSEYLKALEDVVNELRKVI